jgi:hypothetical protein
MNGTVFWDVVQYKYIDVLEEYVASIFRVEE